MTRAVVYAMRRFKLKGIVPKSNPINGAKFNEAICCKEDIDSTEDLRQCALPCDGMGLFNIWRMFPQKPFGRVPLVGDLYFLAGRVVKHHIPCR